MWTCRMKRDWREREGERERGGKRDIRGKDRQTVREEKKRDRQSDIRK